MLGNRINSHKSTFAMALVGQIASLRHCPFTILVVPIVGNSITPAPPTHGTATPTLVIQLR